MRQSRIQNRASSSGESKSKIKSMSKSKDTYIEHRASSIEHQASSIENPASSIQHRESSIEHRESSIENRASRIEHPASSIQHRASSIENRASNNGRPTIAVLYAPGINCHEETAYALEMVGLNGKIVNIHDILAGDDTLTDYQAVIVPGGFSWGDHLGAGRVFGVHLVARLSDQLNQLVESGKPVLGICNGFQVLVETGLLPERTVGKRGAALLQNRSAVFESRWVNLLVTDTSGIWMKGFEGQTLSMPVAHGEGRLYWEDDSLINPTLCYSINGKPTEAYPANPNGSPGGIAGIQDSTGLIFGLMPHPERAVLPWHGSTDGLTLFKNLARYLTL